MVIFLVDCDRTALPLTEKPDTGREQILICYVERWIKLLMTITICCRCALPAVSSTPSATKPRERCRPSEEVSPTFPRSIVPIVCLVGLHPCAAAYFHFDFTTSGTPGPWITRQPSTSKARHAFRDVHSGKRDDIRTACQAGLPRSFLQLLLDTNHVGLLHPQSGAFTTPPIHQSNSSRCRAILQPQDNSCTS